MKASTLIEELQALVVARGDLDVTCGFPACEYSVSSVEYVLEGPMPAWRGTTVQRQNPPGRFMIGLVDDIPPT